MASLGCVDKVAVFDEVTPIKLIESIRPNVLVKGGDYKVNEIVGSKEVKKAGGKVITIPLVKGLSTTKIIKQIT